MDVSKVLEELAAERAKMEEAIISLEQLQSGSAKGPGKPPRGPRRRSVCMADDDPEKRRLEEAIRSIEELARKRNRGGSPSPRRNPPSQKKPN